jgi:ATP-binding cassette subfamily C (CFTR/MRP) protein 1
VRFIEDATAPASDGLWIAAVSFGMMLVQCYATHAPMVAAMNIGAKIRGSLMALIFRKSMRLSNGSRQSSSAGQVVNYMANDAQRFAEFMPMLNNLLLCLPFLCVALYLVSTMLGAATFAGVFVLVLGMVANSKLMGRLKALRSQQMSQTDQRVLQAGCPHPTQHCLATQGKLPI